MRYFRQHPLVSGTIVLTFTGFISRIIGFFYRIYLSRLFGEEGMGIYQLLNPVLALSFSLTAAAWQSAISKSVAEESAHTGHFSRKPLSAGLHISLPLSFICAGIIFICAKPIGTHLLMEQRTVPMLRILAFSIPLSAVHSCINGYFYGIKKAGFPAAAQLFEQLIRVGSVFFLCTRAGRQDTAPSLTLAVTGLVLGELAAMLLTLGALWSHCAANPPKSPKNIPRVHRSILLFALPLTANRIALNLLQSLEAVSIPVRLREYGYDTATALSVFGVLTGMAMPLIFFPNALTGSLAVMLLPVISQYQALGNYGKLREEILRTIRNCLLFGLPFLFFFVFLGNQIGEFLFDSDMAGHFIRTLGWISPLIYLTTALSGILHGLGLTGKLFIMNMLCLLLRLLFVFFLIPRVGITGYLWGILAGQLLHSILYLGCLFGFIKKHR